MLAKTNNVFRLVLMLEYSITVVMIVIYEL
jgi:hypothetical protein